MNYTFIFRKIRTLVIIVLKYIFRGVGLGVTTHINLLALQAIAIEKAKQDLAVDRAKQDLEFIRTVTPSNHEMILRLLDKSKSQLRQDLFVLAETKYKTHGYFVEFGATNGIDLSNTYLLETEYAWRGILAEPATLWHKQLQENRPSSSIETRCIWSDSYSSLIFNETEVPELSTVDIFSDRDGHKHSRQKGKKYEVQTISLNDLLRNHQAPKYIDYLSIDTEGSEYEILKAFDFDEYSFGIITVEHNNTSQRELILTLLTGHGYSRKYESISHFDDWHTKI